LLLLLLRTHITSNSSSRSSNKMAGTWLVLVMFNQQQASDVPSPSSSGTAPQAIAVQGWCMLPIWMPAQHWQQQQRRRRMRMQLVWRVLQPQHQQEGAGTSQNSMPCSSSSSDPDGSSSRSGCAAMVASPALDYLQQQQCMQAAVTPTLLLLAVTVTECLLRSVFQRSPRTAAVHPAAVAAVAAMAAAAGTNLGLLLLLLLPLGARLAVGHVVVHRCPLGSCRILLLLLERPHPLTRETGSAVGKEIALQQQQQGSVVGVRISTPPQAVAAVRRADGGVDSHDQEQQVLLLLLLLLVVLLLSSSSSRQRLMLLVAAVAAVGVG
jgi:hypothetical protein